MLPQSAVKLFVQRGFPAYRGEDPYIYLSFSPFELAEGLAVLRILNEAGCRVRYNENLLNGREWTTEICDAIEDCAVFFEVNAPEYRFSLTKELSHEFAAGIGKKDVLIRLYDRTPEKKPGYPTLIYASLTDPSLPEYCRQGLEAAGYYSAAGGNPASEKYDLMLDYYKTSEDRDRAFGGLLPQSLNLRTHESHGYLGHSPRSDADVYSAVRFGKRKRFYLQRRSNTQDYKPGAADRRFSEMVLKLNGAAPNEPEKEFDPRGDNLRSGRPFPSGYPYMDEFEYLSSDES